MLTKNHSQLNVANISLITSVHPSGIDGIMDLVADVVMKDGSIRSVLTETLKNEAPRVFFLKFCKNFLNFLLRFSLTITKGRWNWKIKRIFKKFCWTRNLFFVILENCRTSVFFYILLSFLKWYYLNYYYIFVFIHHR